MRQPTLADLRALERAFRMAKVAAHDMDKFTYDHCAQAVADLIKECENDKVASDIKI